MINYRSYRPEFLGLLIAVGILNLWYLSGIALDEQILPKNYEHVLRFLSVLIGGFIGAYSAFLLKKHEENSKSELERKRIINFSLFIISRQINAITAIKQDIDKYTSDLDKAFNLEAIKPPAYSDLTHDFKGLSFLIDRDEPQILMDLTIEQERFEQALHAIELRSNFLVLEVQPVVATKGLFRKNIDVRIFRKELGDTLFEGAIHYSRTMYDLINSCESSLKEMLESLRAFAKTEYPGTKFIDWRS